MDLVTLALAKKYTDEKVAEGGGSAVIDLAKLFVAEGVSINDAILVLFQSGGGQSDFSDASGFWDAVRQYRNVKFVIDASVLGAIIEAEAKSIMKDIDGVIGSIETSFLVNTGAWSRVTIAFLYGNFKDGTDTRIVVVVEPLVVLGV